MSSHHHINSKSTIIKDHNNAADAPSRSTHHNHSCLGNHLISRLYTPNLQLQHQTFNFIDTHGHGNCIDRSEQTCSRDRERLVHRMWYVTRNFQLFCSVHVCPHSHSTFNSQQDLEMTRMDNLPPRLPVSFLFL